MSISAIVVHFENDARTRRCVQSLREQQGVSLKTVVVDHSAGGWEHFGLGDECIRPTSNLGFGAGVATAMGAFPAEIILLLNPDAVAEPAWAQEMVSTLKSSPGNGMVACRVRGSDPTRLDSAGLGLSRGGLGILRGIGRSVEVSRSALGSVPLLGPTGAAAAYRTAMLEELGGFPRDYFLYYEDLEVAFRGRRRGWDCAWVDEPLVSHYHESSAGARKPFYLRRAQRLFLERNWPDAWHQDYRMYLWAARTGAYARALVRGTLGQVLEAHREVRQMAIEKFLDPDPSGTWLAPRP